MHLAERDGAQYIDHSCLIDRMRGSVNDEEEEEGRSCGVCMCNVISKPLKRRPRVLDGNCGR